MHILVVEDDSHLCGMIQMLFEGEGYQVSTAGNGQEALDFIQRQKNPPDLIISDVMMPVMDGFRFCETLRKEDRFKKIPFIFLTSLSQWDKRLKAYNVGADDYLLKPFNTEELLLRVKILLDRVSTYQALSPKDTSMSGSLAAVNLVDIIQILELSRKTGSLELTGEGKSLGGILFLEGSIVDADAGNLQREDALFNLLSLKQGFFSFREKPVARDKIRIRKSNTSLIMEGLRLIDELNQYGEHLPGVDALLSLSVENKEAITRASMEDPDVLELLKACKDGPITLTTLLQKTGPLVGELRTRALVGKLISRDILRVEETKKEEPPIPLVKAPPDIRNQLRRIKEELFKSKENLPLKILTFSADSAFIDSFAHHYNPKRSAQKEAPLLSATIHFERVPLPEGVILHLYQLPIEKRFSFMWEALSTEAQGYMIVAEDEASLENAEFIHSFCQKRFHSIPGFLILEGIAPSAAESRVLPSHRISMTGTPENYDELLTRFLEMLLKEKE